MEESCSILLSVSAVVAEEEGDAPQTCDAHQWVDDAADGAHLPAEEEGNAVKAKQTHAAPVQCANDDQHQRQFINDFHGKIPPKTNYCLYVARSEFKYSKNIFV